MKLRKIFVAFFLLISGVLSAQVQFEAKASKTSLGINERLRIDFEMNKDGDNFNPPSFENFRVVGGPNQAISNSWINGKRSYSKTYSYYLAPTATGTFTIGQAEITIEGKVYKTIPLEIKVTAAVDEPTDGNNSEMTASENLHLVAEISETNPYLNEAITVVYKLYVSRDVSVSNWRQIDNPTYQDFWSQNIDIRRLEVQTGEYNGEPYRFVVLRKTILYPQKTGKLNIEPLTLSVEVEVPTDRRTIFGTRLFTTVDKTVAAGNKTIEVKPLPEAGKPGGFTGAVGKDLQFEVSVNKLELNATEALEAKVQVRGSGNLKLFDLPRLEVPSSIEVYEPEYSEEVETNLSGMHGNISNTYTLVPQSEGKYPIPPLTFSYFDLETQTYKTLTSEEIILEVNPDPTTGISTLPNQNAGKPKPAMGDIGNQFRYIKLKASLKEISEKPFLGSAVFWSLLLSPLLLIPIAIIFDRRREEKAKDIKGNRIRKADRLARKYLSEARKNLGNKKEFYISLERALHNYLRARLHITTSEMSKDNIRTLLSEKGVDNTTSGEFIDLIKSCEFARYTPTSNVEINNDYKKAVQVIAKIDKQV
ncbi:MAG TPA: BatD family protein [Salinimicrobium sp.]|nr:BatD family protein [Salinimicrobium sp.]